MGEFRSIDFAALADEMLALLVDPTSNLTAALLLYSMIGLALLVLLVIVIAFIISIPEDEDEDVEAGGAPTGRSATAKAKPSRSAPKRPLTWQGVMIGLGVTAAAVLGVWILAGFTTSTNDVCASCHATTVHDEVGGEDPAHASTECVSCHEPSGDVGRYFTQVPSRILHFAERSAEVQVRGEYGAVTTSACTQCHDADIAKVTTNPATGIKMSHAEPIEAAAKCLDCHAPVLGSVTQGTTGMRTCLRCHDAVIASSSCTTCHDKKAVAAARSKRVSFAKNQIEVVDCGGCHIQVRECDPCHGVRMPHSLAFKAGGHARRAAADFWFNDGKTCAGCHTPVRRPCQKCHTPLLGRGHQKEWATDHQTGVVDSCSCHITYAETKNRNFCELCHSDFAVKASEW